MRRAILIASTLLLTAKVWAAEPEYVRDMRRAILIASTLLLTAKVWAAEPEYVRDIPDEYERMDPELVSLIQSGTEFHLKQQFDIKPTAAPNGDPATQPGG